MSKKKFSEWEKEVGAFAIDESKYDLKQELTKDEFYTMLQEHSGDFHGVAYNVRVKFLEANGYPVTRKNLIDPNLSAKPPKK